MKYVYLMRAGKDHFKVGIANNVNNRVKALQTSNPNLVEVVTAKQTANASQVERQIHKMLESSKLKGGKEWFELSAEQAVDLAIEINKTPTLDVSEIEALHTLVEDQTKSQNRLHRKLENIYNELINDPFNQSKRGLPIKEPKLPPKTNVKNTDDAMVVEAIKVILEEERASTSLLQRRLYIGYGRAARIIELLEKKQVLDELDGIKPRNVNVEMAQRLLNDYSSNASE